jgi:arylsulfatase A-like enzyme
MYVALHAPHSPFQAPQSNIADYRPLYPSQSTRAVVAAMMKVVDNSIRQIVDALNARSFWEDTITVIISDNGGTMVKQPSQMAHSNFPLRGGKGTGFEGGLHTMALIHTYVADLSTRWLAHVGVRETTANHIRGHMAAIAWPRRQLFNC